MWSAIIATATLAMRFPVLAAVLLSAAALALLVLERSSR